MDPHIKSVGQEMAYVWIKFLILSMKIGCVITILASLALLAFISIYPAIIVLVLGLAWCLFWIMILNYIIRKFKLNNIHFV